MRVWSRAGGAVIAAGLFCTAIALAGDGKSGAAQRTSLAPPEASQTQAQPSGKTLIGPASRLSNDVVQVPTTTVVHGQAGQQARPLSIEDADGFAWYNGRKVPILNASTTPFNRPLTESIGGRAAQTGNSNAATTHAAKVDLQHADADGGLRTAVPVSCVNGVGCQLPSTAGVGGDIGFSVVPGTASLVDSTNGGMLAVVSDASAGSNGVRSFTVADNFKAAASGSVTKLCWWGLYADIQPDVLGPPTAHTGADNCSGATAASAHDLGTATGTFSFNNTAATNSTPFSPLCAQYPTISFPNRFDKDVWFRWTAPCTGPVTFQTCNGTTLDTKIGVYFGPTCPTSDTGLVNANAGYGTNGKACHDDSGCGVDWQSLVNFNATQNQVYYLRIGLYPGTTTGGIGRFEIRCDAADCSPQADSFTVKFYADDAGGSVPGTLLATAATGSGLTVDNKFATGNTVSVAGLGAMTQFQYEATLSTGVSVTSGQCYWVEIKNNVTGQCDWFWQTSTDGDQFSQLDVDGAGYGAIVTGNEEHNRFDMAYCINVATNPAGCANFAADSVLYNENSIGYSFSTGSPVTDYNQAYDLVRSGGNFPHGITYIQSAGGASGCDLSLVGTDIYTLVEFYDQDLSGAPDSAPVFGRYLGGILANLGPYTGSGEPQMVLWSLSAPANTYFAPTGDDDVVYVSFHMGTVTAGVFHSIPAGDDGHTDGPGCELAPEPPAIPGSAGMWMIFATFPDNLVEVTGALITGTYYSESWGGANDTDRVAVGADGPLAWGGTNDGTPMFEIRGVKLEDCDFSGVEDSLEIACFDSGYLGTAGCGAGECAVFDMIGTGGLIQSPAFMDPLVETGLGPAHCITAKADTDTNGRIDVPCDTADCDDDGITDSCELNCANSDFNHPGKTCLQAVIDGDISTCGTALDCNGNGTPDDCDAVNNDCDEDGVPDDCQVPPLGNQYPDCNANLTPDFCEVGNGETDCDNSGTLDICEIAFLDCNRNGVTDQCDILTGNSNDADANNVPDECPDICVTPFDGFESSPPFNVGSGLNGIDYEQPGNNDTWFSQGGSTIDSQTCPGLGSQAYAQSSDSNGFTNSELFNADAQGAVPLSSNFTEVTFDWQVVGPRNSDNDIRFFLIDNTAPTADSVVLFWFASDISSVGVPEPGYLHIRDNLGFTTTGVHLVAGQCNKAKVLFDNLNQSVEVQIAVNGGPFNTVYGPAANNVLTPGANRIDYWQSGAFNTGGLPQSGNDANAKLIIDNFQVCESGAAVDCSTYKGRDGQPSTDCNGDQICDLFQINSATDRDGDNQLDICEGFCDDCNHNFIIDSFEIAQGSVADVAPANGVPDVCEPATGYNIDFQSYTEGDIEGQGGWRTIQNADGEIRNDTGMGGAATKYLAVKAIPGSTLANGFVMGPRMDSMGDGGIEIWSWKFRVLDPPGGSSNDFGRVFVEILDLCEDAPALVNNIFGIIGARNAGLEVTRKTLGEDTPIAQGTDLAGGAINVYVLGTFGNVPAYEKANVAQINDVQANVLNNTWAAGLRINNNSGSGQQGGAFWAQTQAHITLPVGATAKLIGNPTTTETVEEITDLNGAFRWRGGDRQLMIRTDGDYGATNDIEFLFDDFKYETRIDCDGDNIPDNTFLATNPTHDRNADGIPDRCQDCDNDCPAFPIAANAVGCLDRCEISAATPGCGGFGGGSLDCNGNLIPDACDVNPLLPNQRLASLEYYAGGGSCDLNGDAIPDECTVGYVDCNGNGCHDPFELATAGFGGTATNVNGGLIDECEADCNHNNIPDVRDKSLGVAGGGSQDADEFNGLATFDGVPDECCVVGTSGLVIAASGDMDHDGDLDAEDYQLLQRCAGQTPPNCPDPGCVSGKGTVRGSATGGLSWDGLQCGCGDFNGDGKVDTCDLQVFQTYITGP